MKTPTLSVIEERMPAGMAEVRHYHRLAGQSFYVLVGTLSMEVNGKELELAPGQGVQVAAGEAHQVRNLSASDVEFLVVSNPPSHGDRILAEANSEVPSHCSGPLTSI